MLPPLNNAFCQHPVTAGTVRLATGSASYRQHPCHPGPGFSPHTDSWRRGRSLPPPPAIYFTAERTQQIRERIRYGSLGLHILLPETPKRYLPQPLPEPARDTQQTPAGDHRRRNPAEHPYRASVFLLPWEYIHCFQRSLGSMEAQENNTEKRSL